MTSQIYLGAMKALEDNPNPEEKILHIVPIGGLVVGSFLRLENELKTVIELWDVQEDEQDPGEGSISTTEDTTSDQHKNGTQEDTPSEQETYNLTEDDATEFVSDDATELHWAVCSGEPDKVRESLESAHVCSTINMPDPHGWTPLHMASVLGNWEICEILLGIEDINLSLINEKGGVALHYIVKHPYNPQQATLIQKVLHLAPAQLFSKNHHGETPLHSACLKANDKVVSLLVGYADTPINSLTIAGETPLHYAVTGGNELTVNILLNAGADPSAEAQRGTPLDLALGYKHHAIASAIRKALGMTEDLGWPRTTRTPPGLHVDQTTGPSIRDSPGSPGIDSDSSEGSYPRLVDSPNSHIQIGTRLIRNFALMFPTLPDKPVLLGLSKHGESVGVPKLPVTPNSTGEVSLVDNTPSVIQITSALYAPKLTTDSIPLTPTQGDVPVLAPSSPQLNHSHSSPSLQERAHTVVASRSISHPTSPPIAFEREASPSTPTPPHSSSPSHRWTMELKNPTINQHTKRHSQASPPTRNPYLQYATESPSPPKTKTATSWLAPSSVPTFSSNSPGWHISASPTPSWHSSPWSPSPSPSPSPTPSPPISSSPNWQTASPPWHTAKIRGMDPKRAMALRSHNKTLSDGNMPFLSKIQAELLASSVPTSSFMTLPSDASFRSHSSDEVHSRVHAHTHSILPTTPTTALPAVIATTTTTTATTTSTTAAGTTNTNDAASDFPTPNETELISTTETNNVDVTKQFDGQ